MSYQPLVIGAGIAGWRFMQRTYEKQFEAFASANRRRDDVAYFRENAVKVSTAEQLVSDRKLLTVVLTAFGLQEDLDNRYFIRKILEDGTSAEDALANRMADERYRNLSNALGFGPQQSVKLTDPLVIEDLLSRHNVQRFELAVGQQSEATRLALYAQRTLGELAPEDVSNDTLWFSVLAQPPLRKVMETAFGLPSSFGQIDLDQQLRVLKGKSQSLLGTSEVRDIAQPDLLDQLTTRFMAIEQISGTNTVASPTSNALAILQASGS